MEMFVFTGIIWEEDGLPYLRPVPPSEDPRNFIPAETIHVFKFKVDVEIRVHA